MNYLSGLKNQIPDRNRLLVLIASAAIGAILLGYALFILFSLLPQLKVWQASNTQLQSAEKALSTLEQAQQSPADLIKRTTDAQARLGEAGHTFFSEAQAAQAFNRLYQYADEAGIVLTNVEAQPAVKVDDKGLYDARTFSIQAQGTLPGLIGFVSRIQEAVLPAFAIADVNLAAQEAISALTMNVTLYTSPYAGSEVIVPPLATPVVFPTSTVLPTATAALEPTSTPAPTATALPTPTVIQQPSPTAVPPPATIYIVRQGDTLYSIARRYGITVEALMAANGLTGTRIYAGQQLYIPQ